MAVEIEKKYKLTNRQQELIRSRLPEIGAQLKSQDFEVNTLYSGEGIDEGRAVLRLRRVGKRAILTFKERLPSEAPIKHQLEDETEVSDPDAMESILDSLGFSPTLVYEKRRERWELGETEIVVDELPFGLFMEIEGTEAEIEMVESELAIKGLQTEFATYPQLARKHGINSEGVIEACFKPGD